MRCTVCPRIHIYSSTYYLLLYLPHGQAYSGAFASELKGSVLSTLLDAGLLFLLRFSLDDGVEGVMAAAAQALRALLVSADDEVTVSPTHTYCTVHPIHHSHPPITL